MTVGTWKIFPPNLCERKKNLQENSGETSNQTHSKTRTELFIKTYRKTRAGLLIKTRWQEKPRRDHWDASSYPLVTSMVGVSLMQWGEVPAFCWVGDWPGPRALLCIKRAPSVLQGEGRQVLCGSSWVSVLLWFVLLQDRRRLLSRLWRHVSGNRTCHQRYILNVLFRQKENQNFRTYMKYPVFANLILYFVQKAIKEIGVPCSLFCRQVWS